MADMQNQFLEVLASLLSTDNDYRTKAEEVYEKTEVGTRLTLLLQIISDENCTIDIRCLAAVLMRRIYASEWEEISKLNPELLENVRSKILESSLNVADDLVRKKLCDLIAEVARNTVEVEEDNDKHGWPDVLQFIINCSNAENSNLKEMAMIILSYVPSIFGVLQHENVDMIKRMIMQSLVVDNYAVKVSAAKALCQFLIANDDDENIINSWRNLTLDPLLNVLSENIAKDEDLNILKSVVEVADACPKYFRPRFQQLIGASINLLSDNDKTSTVKHLALELIVTMSESAAASMRKLCGDSIPPLVQKLLSEMTEIEHEDEEWNVADEVEDEESDATVAETSLDRLCVALGARTMAPTVMAGIKELLSKEDSWQARHAGLMALSACGEGCKAYFESGLTDLISAVLPFLHDNHPRVRYAACNAVGQMCSDFGPTLQKSCHQIIMPALLNLLSQESIPKVQSHAAAALINYCDDAPRITVVPYLEPILQTLNSILVNCSQNVYAPGSKMVLEQIVMTLASAAESAEEKFIPYYDQFVPGLLQIIEQTGGKKENTSEADFRLLRGKTIECVSYIGLAVGREKFQADAETVMQLLLISNQTQILEDDDPQLPYLIGAWARMAKIIGGHAFAKYLPLVMPPVLKTAALKPEVALLDQDELDQYETQEDWQVVNMGEQQKLAIKTAGMEDKANAFQMLVSYLKELGGQLGTYLEEIVKLIVGHLRFYFHEVVRMYAAEALPLLLDCAKDVKGEEAMMEMWRYLCPEILKTVESEPETDVKCEFFHSLAQCIEKCGKNCLNQEQTESLCTILCSELDNHMKNALEIEAKRASKTEDYDPEVEEDLLREAEEGIHMLEQLSNIFHSYVGTQREDSLAFIEQVVPRIDRLLNGGSTGKSWTDRQWGICMVDDIIEHSGELSLRYRSMFLERLLNGLGDERPEIRQAAAYGVGIMASSAALHYQDVCIQVLPTLAGLIQAPKARDVENNLATDNILSALTKIMKTFGEQIQIDQFLPVWLQGLPVQEDEEEAVHIYEYLCEAHSKIFTSPEAMAHCLSAIGHSFYVKLLSSEESEGTRKKLLQLVHFLQSNNTDIFNSCMERVEVAHKTALLEALASVSSQ
ncbi:DgyrCDS6944 [Dimorphilus gyrociliatus]|uniref:DgyrCDS6944 n=1 Tax=Dimorphilus gyrociliatus TaxID=2664684 RepID=A0A7I8VPJ8_9ANNE|nr:DgyrCDS6944 [Dimorphilus gyrociliatus]